MKRLRLLLWCVPIYFGAWTLAYVAIMGGDFRYYFSYLGLAWTGQAGELPGFMHVAALGTVFLFGLIATVAIVRRKRNALVASAE